MFSSSSMISTDESSFECLYNLKFLSYWTCNSLLLFCAFSAKLMVRNYSFLSSRWELSKTQIWFCKNNEPRLYSVTYSGFWTIGIMHLPSSESNIKSRRLKVIDYWLKSLSISSRLKDNTSVSSDLIRAHFSSKYDYFPSLFTERGLVDSLTAFFNFWS